MTTSQHGDAQIREIQPQTIYRHANEGRIVVVAGFQGINEHGDITTLGRGGSDTTATALGAALSSKSVEIYTDVNGVMTADPRLVPSAKTLKTICYADMHQLALLGAKVVHPRAVEVAMRHNLSLKVKCAFTEEKGTHICHDAECSVERTRGRGAAGIAHQTDYALLRLNTHAVNDQRTLWGLVGNAKIVDSYNLVGECLTITGSWLAMEELATAVTATGAEITQLIGDCAQLSLVGGDPNTMSEAAIRFLSTLKADAIQVRNLEVRPSVISGLVPTEQLADAAHAIHQEFFGDCIKGGD
jgi:aspartate kinase